MLQIKGKIQFLHLYEDGIQYFQGQLEFHPSDSRRRQTLIENQQHDAGSGKNFCHRCQGIGGVQGRWNI